MLTRFTLRQLEYFIATAETGSILITSEKIHISASSISSAITNLEEELEAQLFIRQHAKGLILTEVGKTVLALAKKIINDSENLYDVVAEITNQVSGILHIGCLDDFAAYLYKEMFYDFSQLYPKVELSISDDTQNILMQKLLNSELDLVLTHNLDLNPKLTAFEPLVNLYPYVLVSELHPLARSSAVTLEELSQYPMVLHESSQHNDYYISLFYQKKLTPNIINHSKHFDVVKTMVSNNLGYTITNIRPKYDSIIDGSRLIKLRLAGEHKPMKLGIVTLNSNIQHSLAAQVFIERCRLFISDQYIPGMQAPYFTNSRKKLK